MSQQLKVRLYCMIALLFLFAGCGLYWYFHIHVQTPEYALQQIETSLESHDQKKFQRYVDVDRLTESSYDGFVEGFLDVESALPAETKSAITDLAKMMKAPILASFKEAISRYVATGEWAQPEVAEDASGRLESSDFLTRSGIPKTTFRKVDSVAEDGDRAVANIRVYQQEAGEEFVLETVLEKSEHAGWHVTGIQNFPEFIRLVERSRRAQLDNYLKDTAIIMERHDRVIQEAEMKYGELLSTGSLGRQKTRDELRDLMQDVIQKDWEERRQELESVETPEAAQTLQHLRLRICDLHIAYARGYALWMTDKKAATIREADLQLKQAKTLEQEAKTLTRRMESLKAN